MDTKTNNNKKKNTEKTNVGQWACLLSKRWSGGQMFDRKGSDLSPTQEFKQWNKLICG